MPKYTVEFSSDGRLNRTEVRYDNDVHIGDFINYEGETYQVTRVIHRVDGTTHIMATDRPIDV